VFVGKDNRQTTKFINIEKDKLIKIMKNLCKWHGNTRIVAKQQHLHRMLITWLSANQTVLIKSFKQTIRESGVQSENIEDLLQIMNDIEGINKWLEL